MKNSFAIFLLIFVLLSSCRVKQSVGAKNNISSIGEIDSIKVFASKLEGDWNAVSERSNPNFGFLFPDVESLEIRNWRNVHSEALMNQLEISGTTSEWLKNGTKLSMQIHEYQASIKNLKNDYGLVIKNDSINTFLVINRLNDSILEFENGQIYKRL